MAMSNYLKNALLSHTLCNTPFVSPTGVFVSLHTAEPSNGGFELSGNGYTRVPAIFDPPTAEGVCLTVADTAFPSATSSWGTVTHFAIWDDATAGSMLFYGAVTTPKEVLADDRVIFPQGDLTVSFT